MSEGLRLGAVRVTAELMYALFRTSPADTWFRTSEGLPPDAEFVRSYHDDARNEWVFVYTHPTFPLARPGEPVTFLPPPLFEGIHGVRYDRNTGQVVVLSAFHDGKDVRVAKTQEEFDYSPPPKPAREVLEELLAQCADAPHIVGGAEP